MVHERWFVISSQYPVTDRSPEPDESNTRSRKLIFLWWVFYYNVSTCTYVPKDDGEWLVVLVRIRDILGSNLGRRPAISLQNCGSTSLPPETYTKKYFISGPRAFNYISTNVFIIYPNIWQQRPIFLLFTPCMFLHSIYHPTYTLCNRPFRTYANSYIFWNLGAETCRRWCKP